jgi:DMSO/TMAO reductase YedYZ heme-binding membrane subunit
LIISLFGWWWSVAIYDNVLTPTRLQELYGWLSVGFIVLTLLIGPVMKLCKGIPGRPLIYDSRRAVGISAAWFALLHAVIVYFGQLQAGNPFSLPTLYKQSLLLGLIALVCLLILAATSVNAVMRRWGIWWFRVHRLIYLAILLAIIHAFMIGAHAASLPVLIALATISLVWTVLHGYIAVVQPDKRSIRFASVCISLCVLTLVMGYGASQYIAQKADAQSAAEHSH